MTYSLSMISNEKDGRQVVWAPRNTDAIGHALRGAFDANSGLSEDIVSLLQRLDAVQARPH